MRRIPVISGVFVAGALAVAACSGGPAASTVPTIPPINVPSIPPINVPSIAIPTLPIGSFAIPTFPSFAPDTDLQSKFPTTVSDSPVTGVASANFVQFYQAFTTSDPAAQAKVQAFVTILQSNGINPTTFSIGYGHVELNGSSETITAFHTPGSSAATFLSLFPQLAAIDATNETPPIIATANVGGKSVTTVDDGSGSIDYLYPSGEVLWSVSTDSPDNAAAIMSALQ